MSDSTHTVSAPAIKPETPPLSFDAHGVLRVAGTRVTLDTLVAAFQRGETPEEIARNYDALSLGDVYQALGFFLAHQAEFEDYLRQRQELRTSIQQGVEMKHNPIGIRDRLLARRRQQKK